jgi:hypothetical protein
VRWATQDSIAPVGPPQTGGSALAIRSSMR